MTKIKEFAKRHLPNFSASINSLAEMDEFLSQSAVPNKAVLFTDKPHTPPLFKGLTSRFRERLDFAEIVYL